MDKITNKYIKSINNYIIDEMYKGNHIHYYEEYFSDSYMIVKLKDENCFLDKNKMIYTKEIEKFINKEFNLFNIKTWYITENRKIVKLVDENDVIHAIDKKYFKLFMDLNCEIKVESFSERSPILFYMKEELIGYVLPIVEY